MERAKEELRALNQLLYTLPNSDYQVLCRITFGESVSSTLTELINSCREQSDFLVKANIDGDYITTLKRLNRALYRSARTENVKIAQIHSSVDSLVNAIELAIRPEEPPEEHRIFILPAYGYYESYPKRGFPFG